MSTASDAVLSVDVISVVSVVDSSDLVAVLVPHDDNIILIIAIKTKSFFIFISPFYIINITKKKLFNVIMILFFDFGFHQVDPVTSAVNVTLDTSGRTFFGSGQTSINS